MPEDWEDPEDMESYPTFTPFDELEPVSQLVSE